MLSVITPKNRVVDLVEVSVDINGHEHGTLCFGSAAVVRWYSDRGTVHSLHDALVRMDTILDACDRPQ